MEQDPVAQKRVAKIAKYRGEYDRWGNRYTKTMLNTRHLLQNSNEDIFQTIKKEMEDTAVDDRPRSRLDLSQYNLGGIHY